MANEWNLGFSGSNWAVVYHNANYYDYMLDMTSDTPNGDEWKSFKETIEWEKE